MFFILINRTVFSNETSNMKVYIKDKLLKKYVVKWNYVFFISALYLYSLDYLKLKGYLIIY